MLDHKTLQTLLHKCSDSLLSISFHPADSLLEPGVRDPTEATSAQYSCSQQLSPLTSSRMESPRLILKNQVIPLQICPVQLKLPDSTAQPVSQQDQSLYSCSRSFSITPPVSIMNYGSTSRVPKPRGIDYSCPVTGSTLRGTGQAVSTVALHYAQTQFCCWMIDNNYWMSLF